jgi:WD40 repeat protein
MHKRFSLKVFQLSMVAVATNSVFAEDLLETDKKQTPGRRIFQVAFSHDGKTLATAGRRSTDLWDVQSYKRIGALKTSNAFVQSLSWSPNTKKIAETNRRGEIQIWSTSSARPVRTIGGKEFPACCVAFSPDGFKIMTASYRVPSIWDAVTGRQVVKLEALLPKNAAPDLCATINDVAWSPDGKYVAAGTDGMGVQVWNVVSGKIVLKLEPLSIPTIKIDFSPDGKTLVAGRDDGFILLWDTVSGRQLKSFRAHDKRVADIVFTRDGRRLVSAGDACVKLWDINTGVELQTFPLPRGYSHAIALAPDGKTLAASGWDGVRLIDIKSGIEKAKLDPR